MDDHWQSEKQFDPIECGWVHQPHLKEGPMPSSDAKRSEWHYCGLLLQFTLCVCVFLCYRSFSLFSRDRKESKRGSETQYFKILRSQKN